MVIEPVGVIRSALAVLFARRPGDRGEDPLTAHEGLDDGHVHILVAGRQDRRSLRIVLGVLSLGVLVGQQAGGQALGRVIRVTGARHAGQVRLEADSSHEGGDLGRGEGDEGGDAAAAAAAAEDDGIAGVYVPPLLITMLGTYLFYMAVGIWLMRYELIRMRLRSLRRKQAAAHNFIEEATGT